MTDGNGRFGRGTLLGLAALVLTLLLTPTAQAMPGEFGISQSYRNFGLRVNEGPYDPTKDVTRSLYWGPLNVPRLRVIIPWDIAGRPVTDDRREEFQHWLNRVNQLGAEPYVVFGPTELMTNIYNSQQSTRRIDGTTECDTTPEGSGDGEGCIVAPFAGTYKVAIEDFLEEWGIGTAGNVRNIGAWNEPDNGEIEMVIPGSTDSAVYLPAADNPLTEAVDAWTTNKMSSLTGGGGTTCPGGATSSNCGPLLAAWYWKYALDAMIEVGCVASNCRVVAGEFTTAPNRKNYWETYANKVDYVGTEGSTFYAPNTISFHGHQDLHPLGTHVGEGVDHDCKPSNLTWCIGYNFDKWLSERGGVWAERSVMKLWSTETGAQRANSTNAAQDARFKEVMKIYDERHVARLYYFNFQGGGQNDRGLIDDGATVDTAKRTIWDTIRCRNSCPGWSLPPAPTVTTTAATGVLATQATLNGTVNPNGVNTFYRFEYGKTTSYGTSTPIPDAWADPWIGAISPSANVSGLQSKTTYHYRIVATSSRGTSNGADKTFTTP